MADIENEITAIKKIKRTVKTMTQIEQMIFEKLKAIEEKLDQLPREVAVKEWIAASVVKHTLDCSSKKVGPRLDQVKFWGTMTAIAALALERWIN